MAKNQNWGRLALVGKLIQYTVYIRRLNNPKPCHAKPVNQLLGNVTYYLAIHNTLMYQIYCTYDRRLIYHFDFHKWRYKIESTRNLFSGLCPVPRGHGHTHISTLYCTLIVHHFMTWHDYLSMIYLSRYIRRKEWIRWNYFFIMLIKPIK